MIFENDQKKHNSQKSKSEYIEQENINKEESLDERIQLYSNQNDDCKLNYLKPKELIFLLESKLSDLGKGVPKRDRLHSSFMKRLRDYLTKDFTKFIPEFEHASNDEKLKNYLF